MTEEIDYKQRVENYKKFFKEWSGSWVGIEIDNETYYAFTADQHEKMILNMKYKPYYTIKEKIRALDLIKKESDTLSSENSEATFQEYRHMVDKYTEVIDEILHLLQGMRIVGNYKKNGTEFEIEWIHGYKPLNEE